MAHDVFISYSSKDKTIADAVCARLETHGVRCWIAPRDVHPGLPYAEEIIDAIQNCRVMVLVLSANANTSPHIPKEIERAVSRGVPVIPLRVENVMPAKSLDYFISSVHWLDAITPPLEQHLESLANTVLAILQQSGVPVSREVPRAGVLQPQPATPVPPTASATNGAAAGSKWIALAAVVAVVLVAAWYFWGRSLSSPGSEAPVVNGFNSGSPTPSDSLPRTTAVNSITGCWHWFNNVTVVINPEGTMQAGPFTAQWRIVDPARRIYQFTWPEAVDTLLLSPDGHTLAGGNQYGFSTSAARLSPGAGIVGSWRWPNGAIVSVRPDGHFAVANFAGRWEMTPQGSYALTWPKPIDTVTVSADFRRLSGANQYGIRISGTKMNSCSGI
jgi:TIR domain